MANPKRTIDDEAIRSQWLDWLGTVCEELDFYEWYADVYLPANAGRERERKLREALEKIVAIYEGRMPSNSDTAALSAVGAIADDAIAALAIAGADEQGQAEDVGKELYLALAREVIGTILTTPVECYPEHDIRLRLACIIKQRDELLAAAQPEGESK